MAHHARKPAGSPVEEPQGHSSAALNMADLNGAALFSSDGQEMGVVSEIIDDGSDPQVVVDVGGFLGVGAKPVTLSTTDLRFMRRDDGSIFVIAKWDQSEIGALPPFLPRFP
ncbi:PRC-barrel domain containing protein [Escherichia coli]|nr:PRC-barrel domain containing protein [Escherichia coli]